MTVCTKNSNIMIESCFGAPFTFANNDKPILVWVNDSIPVEYFTQIQRAIDKLNDVCNGLTFKLIKSKYFPMGDINLSKMNKDLQFIFEDILLPDKNGIVGVNMSMKSNIFSIILRKGSALLFVPKYYDKTYQITLHEIMYSLGFKDVDNDSIMNRYLNRTEDLTTMT